MTKKVATLVALFILLCVPVTVFAGVEPSPWRLANSQGFNDPTFWALFSPQDLAQMGIIDASDPMALILMAQNLDDGRFAFGFDITGALDHESTGAIAGSNQLTFRIYDGPVGGLGMLGYTLTITFDGLIATGVPVELWFPAPLAGGFPNGEVYALFTLVGPTGAPIPDGSSVDATLRIYDSNGEPVAFEAVPEPASLLLLGTGLVGLRAWRKRRQ